MPETFLDVAINDRMWEFAMKALAQLVVADMELAIGSNSVYRETNTYQWARRAAHKAFTKYPNLRGEEGSC